MTYDSRTTLVAPPMPPSVPMDTPPNVPSVLGPGLWMQIYRDAIRSPNEVPVWLDRYQLLGVTGIIWHGFPTEDPKWLDPLMLETHARGMKSGASEGLDTTKRTGAQKGESLGLLAKEHKADIVGLDGESHFDPASATQEARDMRLAFRAHAPDVIAFDQAWPQPSAHPHFPYAEMAQAVQIRADQRYLKPWRQYLGKNRYVQKWPEWEKEWVTLERTVLSSVLRQRAVTIEQYDYADIIADGCEIVIRHPLVFAWGEPWPDSSFVLMLQARQFLVRHAFIADDWHNAFDAIERFQHEYNRTASTKLDEDNRCGPLTAKAMGFRLQ